MLRVSGRDHRRSSGLTYEPAGLSVCPWCHPLAVPVELGASRSCERRRRLHGPHNNVAVLSTPGGVMKTMSFPEARACLVAAGFRYLGTACIADCDTSYW